MGIMSILITGSMNEIEERNEMDEIREEVRLCAFMKEMMIMNCLSNICCASDYGMYKF